MENCNLENLKGKNWMAAMSLCWFLGSFGAHRFYTGKTDTAWVMAICSISGILAPISAVWMLVDGVMLALGQFTHADGSELYERIPAFGYLFLVIVALTILIGILMFALFSAISVALFQELATHAVTP